MKKHTVRVNIAAAFDAVDTHQAARLTVRELVSSFDAHHPTQAITHHLARWLDSIGDMDAWSITTPQLRRAVNALLDGGYLPGYTNRQLSALRSAYKWAQDRHLTPADFRSPTKDVRRKAEAIRRVVVDPKDVQRLRDGAHAHRDRRFSLLVNLLLDTGARPSELLARRWDEVDLDKREILAPLTKTGVPRVLFFSTTTANLARRLRPNDLTQLVFAGRTGSPNKFYKAWRNLVTGIGLPDLHMYDCRHLVAARLLRAGTTLGVASQVLGHSSLILHSRYGHLETQPLRTAQEMAWSKG